MPVNPHGGSLSEGGSQGAGHVREAVLQLRGQRARARCPTPAWRSSSRAGFFFNAQGLVLRSDR